MHHRHHQDTSETDFLFQRLSITLQRGDAVSFLNTMNNDEKPLQPFNTLLSFHARGFVLVSIK